MTSTLLQQPDCSLDVFLRASANVLEFSIFTLQGTGVGKPLQMFFSDKLGEQLYQPWILRLYELPTNPQAKQEAIEAILTDSCYGPLTQTLLSAWYTGSWDNSYQNPENKTTEVITTQTYQEGLMWPVFGAHPQGAKQQGWDAWSRPPTMPVLT